MNLRNISMAVTMTTLALAACAAPATEVTSQSDGELITDAATIVKRPDGNFDVTCANGTKEIATAIQVSENRVCNAAPVSSEFPSSAGPNDPFAPDACPAGPSWTLATVEAKLPAGTLKGTAPASLFVRFASAQCARRSDGSTSCAAWQDVPSAMLRNAIIGFSVDPVQRTFAVSAGAWERGQITTRRYSCINESGDLCPVGLSFNEYDFGVHLTPTAATGYAGYLSRSVASILLGQAERTRAPQQDVGFGVPGVVLETAKGYNLGAVEIYPTESYDRIAERLDAAIADSANAKAFQVEPVRMTTSCGLMYLRSPAPAASETSWTKTVGAALFRY